MGVTMNLSIVFLACILCHGVRSVPTTIDIHGGSLKGEWSPELGVSRFLGVPFASAPVGNLRFAPPQELAAWSGEHDSSSFKPACPQDLQMVRQTSENISRYWNVTNDILPQSQTSEDCLYLNVFVPGEVQTNRSFSVMVHFQDGGFQFGQPEHYDGSQLAATGDVIVVTSSFRLGALGFFGKSNSGLLDQHFVLKWVQKNIGHFGGDPAQVTIFGSGSGAFSVGIHVLAADSRGLFRRAISQGATAMNVNFLNSQPDVVTNAFSTVVNCDAMDMACLRKLPLNRILEVQTNLMASGLYFMPTVDGDFLPAPPLEMMMTQNFNKVDYMLGFNSDAGFWSVGNIFEGLANGMTDDYFKGFVRGIADYGFRTNADAVNEALLYEYASSKTQDNYGRLRSVLDILRDGVASEVRGAQMMLASAGLDVYGFYYDQALKVIDAKANLLMAPAGAEEFYLFGNMNDPFSHRLMNTWASFAKTGSPVIYLDDTMMNWPLFNLSDPKIAYLKSARNTNVIDSLPHNIERRMPFWMEVLPKIASSESGSCTKPTKPTEGEEPMVKLEQGHIQGRTRVTLDNRFTYQEYYDIPYAAPPVGDLRWRSPQPHRGWKGVIKTNGTVRKMCPQNLGLMPSFASEVLDEDCLTLDIYVPYGVEHVKYRKLPVMIFIHGGGYALGSKNMYGGAGLIQRDVILVAINYRLGHLGFLSTGDEALPGNLGLLDQQFAFKWVNENIGHFGGDHDEITIFGESAGAGSVNFQLVAPSNKGLFKRAISQSGSIWSPWSLRSSEVAMDNTKEIAKALNCSSGSSFMMINCLRKLPSQTVVSAAAHLLLGPVIDGDFIPKAPEGLYADNVTRDVTVMMGYNAAEGVTSLGYDLLHPQMEVLFKELQNISPAVWEAYKFYYADLLENHNNRIADEAARIKIMNFVTDYQFAAPIDKETKLHARYGGRMYRYYFRFPVAFSQFIDPIPAYAEGAHGDDLVYVFGYPCVKIPEFEAFPTTRKNRTWPERDIQLCHQMMDLWTNFATTGDPTKGRYHFNVEWPLYSEDSPNIFEISSKLGRQSGMDAVVTPMGSPDQLRPQKISFWNDLFEKLKQIANSPSEKCVNATASP